MEWEQEQLRRGGLRAEESDTKPQKQTYKPAPSTWIVVSLMYIRSHLTQYPL